MRTSSRCSCSCCGSTTRPSCSSWAAKWQRCTIWSACGARSGCSWAEKEVGEVVTSAGQPPPTSTNLLNLPRPPYLGAMNTGGPLRQPIPVARSILWSPGDGGGGGGQRSEEHTSELQSPCNLVCRLLLEKKKKGMILRVWSEFKRSRLALLL